MQISKTHEAYLLYKQLLKNNKTNNLVITDDLSILKLVTNYDINLKTFFYCYDEEYHEDTKNLILELEKKAKETYTISKKMADSIKQKENSALLFGIIELKEYSFKDFKNKDYLVVCDSLEIPGNLGTIYRTLDSANVDGLILVDPITKITNNKLVSSARGCNLLIPTISVSYDEALNYLQNEGYDIFLGEPNLGKDYKSYDYKGKIAIVVGNERFGINNDWYNHKHKKVFIPMFGSNNSLNVSVAASILVYEATMNRKNN